MIVYKKGYTIFPNQESAEAFIIKEIMPFRMIVLNKAFWIGDLEQKIKHEKDCIRHTVYYKYQWSKDSKISTESRSYVEMVF